MPEEREQRRLGDEPAEAQEPYEPPRVEEVPAQEGPAVTAAGGDGTDIGPEWQPPEPPQR